MIVVAGIGNVLRSDDGFGPAVIQRLQAEEAVGRALPDGVRLVDAGVRTMHLAYDLAEGVELFIAIDTMAPETDGDDEPGTLLLIEPELEAPPTGPEGHGMDLHQVWELAHRLGPGPDRSLLIGCVPADLGDRMQLTAAVASAVVPAASLVRTCVEELT